MTRTAEQKAYHAAKEREYRRRRQEVKRAALDQLMAAAAVLADEHGYTLGQLVDVLRRVA